MLVEVNCESDFVARTEDSRNSSTTSRCTSPRAIRNTSAKRTSPRPILSERRKSISIRRFAAANLRTSRKKWSNGKMEKFYEEVCLLEQPFIKDQTVSIGQLIATKVGKLGENIAVRRFARFKVGDAGETIAVTKPTEQKAE